MEPFRRAKYDLLWVIDATICTTPHVLGRMVDAFVSRPKTDVENSPLLNDSERPPPARGDVGLVHQVPIAVVYQRSWGSLIEQAYLNSTHAKMYLSIVSDTERSSSSLVAYSSRHRNDGGAQCFSFASLVLR